MDTHGHHSYATAQIAAILAGCHRRPDEPEAVTIPRPIKPRPFSGGAAFDPPPVKQIRAQLGVTQLALAQALGCTQGNLGHIEAGTQEITVQRAKKLIAFAAARGHVVTLDQIYADPAPA